MRRTTGCAGLVVAPTRICELAIGAPPELTSRAATGPNVSASCPRAARALSKHDSLAAADIPAATKHACRAVIMALHGGRCIPERVRQRQGSIHIPVLAGLEEPRNEKGPRSGSPVRLITAPNSAR